MRSQSILTLGMFLGVSLGSGQQAAPVTATPAATPSTAEQTVYNAGPGVVGPELLPVTVTDLVTGQCKGLDGDVLLAATVGADGIPRDVRVLRPIGEKPDNVGLDNMALKLVNADRFKPGTHDGTPAAVAVSVQVRLQACIEEKRNEAGQKVYDLRLRSTPDQKVHPVAVLNDAPPEVLHPGADVTAPVLVHQVNAQYTDQARWDGLSGICILGLIVDAQGNPQNLHILRSLRSDLDQKAIEAVSKYRFKPARKKDGTPVPVLITVEVAFHLYR